MRSKKREYERSPTISSITFDLSVSEHQLEVIRETLGQGRQLCLEDVTGGPSSMET